MTSVHRRQLLSLLATTALPLSQRLRLSLLQLALSILAKTGPMRG